MAREAQQGPEHINQLFQKKTCEGVLQSVDKSNPTVNTFCAIAAGASVLFAPLGIEPSPSSSRSS